MSPGNLASLVDQRRVILCVGCGGVGKTTVSAALALAAAVRGKRALCLTIDPAKRLANALGLERMDTEARRIAPELFAEAGLDVPGSLTVMMLDTKRTFDDLIARHAPSSAIERQILQNPIYLHLSTRLAGTQEYMAMEKLLSVEQDENHDLIVLDTPPTSNALDFLDAPERLIAVLDSPATRWFAQSVSRTSGSRHGLLANGAALALRGFARLLGSGFSEQVAEFITELNGLFGGFKFRAQTVARALRRDDHAYVLVTSPAQDAIREVLYFAKRLEQLGIRRDAFVVNRLHRAPRAHPSSDQVTEALARHRIVLGSRGVERLLRAATDELQWAARDAISLSELGRALQGSRGDTPPIRVDIPALPADVHELRTLAGIAQLLVGS